MIRLYDFSASPNCYKVRLLCAQTGCMYERVAVDIFDGETLTDEFRRLNPHRSVPVLELPDGRTLIESNAILWYLASQTEFLPGDSYGQAEVCRWMLFEQSDVMPAIGGLAFRVLTGRLSMDSPEANARRAKAHEALEIIEGHLASRSYLAGQNYTIADISVFAYSHRTADAGIDADAYPRFSAWLSRVRSQPGFIYDLAPYPSNASRLVGRSIYG